MTEGSIAAWRVKEGDKYSVGDVLLEIETDKATMDVEAQDDGIVFKIVQPDGSKGVPVGTRIAVLAEADDDISTLEMPADEPATKSETKPAESQSAAAAETPKSESTKSASSDKTVSKSSSSSSSSKKADPSRPLYPSVQHLIKQNGLDPAAVVGDMTPTGPGGRLLKGDVLAYLGQVSAGVPAELETRFEHLSHLDLSNIKIKAPAPAKEAPKDAAAAAAKAAKAAAPKPTTTSVSLPVSFEAVIEAQDKIQSSLGVFMPISTFVSRATDVANDELPRAGPAPAPSASQLFDELTSGRKSTSTTFSSKYSQGHYRPSISALPTTASASPRAPKAKRSVDVLDILSGKVKATTTARSASSSVKPGAPAVSTGINFFTLSVPKDEEKRAKVFLERLKVVLENEPGRLVL